MATTNTIENERTNLNCMTGSQNARNSLRNSKPCDIATADKLKVGWHLYYLMNGCGNLIKSSLTITEKLCYRLINVPLSKLSNSFSFFSSLEYNFSLSAYGIRHYTFFKAECQSKVVQEIIKAINDGLSLLSITILVSMEIHVLAKMTFLKAHIVTGFVRLVFLMTNRLLPTSSLAHLFAIRGKRKRGPGTLQTRDQNLPK